MPAIEPWAKRHLDKWERVAGAIPGLQFIDVDKQHFDLRVSLPHLEESLVVGRPRKHTIIHPGEDEVRRAVVLKRQPPEARIRVDPEIDVDDAVIDLVLECWRRGESAATVAPVTNLTRQPAPPPAGGWAAM